MSSVVLYVVLTGLYITGHHTWTGGFDLPTENAWVWAGTTTPWKYTNWRHGKPVFESKEVHGPHRSPHKQFQLKNTFVQSYGD